MAKPKNKPLKRFNGQGTVYKLSGRRRRPWVAQVTNGWEEVDKIETVEELEVIKKTKKRLYEIIGYFEERNQAVDALDKHRLTPDELKSTMTLKQAYEAWSKNKLNADISKSTKDGIKASWKKLANLENRQFSGIRSDEFQDIMDYYRDIEKASESSLIKLKSLIFALCDYAYHNSILKTNYSSLIKIGKVETSEREPFNDFEVELFKKNVDTVPWVDTILVLCYTGMRIAEMVTLTKFNVDMKTRLITGGIKTDAGKDRIIPIHPLIYPIFTKWYNKNGETIFCEDEGKNKGKKMSARTYREKKFAPALAALGVRQLTPHSCRHTFATMMNRVNAPSANIQKLIGHVVGSDTTDKVYTHPEIEDLRKTIEMLK
jgi:integrase